MSEEKIKQEIGKLSMEIATKKEELKHFQKLRSEAKPIFCPECDTADWTVTSNFDPFKPLAFAIQTLYLECGYCQKRVEIDCTRDDY